MSEINLYNLSSEIPYGCCHCGCGQKTKIAPVTVRKYGYVRGEPIRFIIGHSQRNGKKYEIDAETGCWNWLRGKTRQGYARVRFNGRWISAHRVMFELKYGPVDKEMDLDHLCRNRKCVNPDHLEVVTPAENTRRGKVAKLDENAVRNIRELYASGNYSLEELGRPYGVTLHAIYSVIHRKTWKDV